MVVLLLWGEMSLACASVSQLRSGLVSPLGRVSEEPKMEKWKGYWGMALTKHIPSWAARVGWLQFHQ